MVPTSPPGRLWAWPENDASVTPNGNVSLKGVVVLIRALIRDYPIDPSRVYVMGCSDGGTGSYGAAHYYPDLFAAAVPISGFWDPNDAPNMLSLPMWALHGSADPVIPAKHARFLNEGIKALGGREQFYTEIPGGSHDCPNPNLYQDAMWKWLFSHQRQKI
jgi:predicted peptidase